MIRPVFIILAFLAAVASAPASAAKTATPHIVIPIAYGDDPAQMLDLYLPDTAANISHPAPIILMVHGGGWKYGDKSMSRMIDNKLAYWRAKGYLFASTNYRMLPDADPYVQAQDVARAIAKLQAIAPQYQGDPNRMIVMGHSAGGHLVALLSSDPAIAAAQGAAKWRATVVLDAGALDVASVMKKKHMRLYNEPFGTDPAYWSKVSPIESIKTDALPMMLVCALKRPDDSCGQSRAFADRLKAIGHDTPVLEENLTHREANEELGLPGAYTEKVHAYIESRLRP